MSAVVVLTPIVVASWPALSAAVAGAAAAMGMSAAATQSRAPELAETRAETELEDTEVVGEDMAAGQVITLKRGNATIAIRQDDQGRCRVCASSGSMGKRALQSLADEVAGRVVQQFVYHKLLTALKERNGEVVSQEKLADESVRVHVRL